MKHARIFTAVVALCFAGQILDAQEQAPTYGQQTVAMSKLKPLLGRWKGSGWIEMEARRYNFESSETFEEQAGGLAISVQGIHRMRLPDGQLRVIHNAFAMINYDAESKKYRFLTQLANGRAGDYIASMTDDGSFQWVIPDTPMGKMVYTISISNNEYHEIGELEPSAGDRTQFFEMRLTRSESD